MKLISIYFSIFKLQQWMDQNVVLQTACQSSNCCVPINVVNPSGAVLPGLARASKWSQRFWTCNEKTEMVALKRTIGSCKLFLFVFIRVRIYSYIYWHLSSWMSDTMEVSTRFFSKWRSVVTWNPQTHAEYAWFFSPRTISSEHRRVWKVIGLKQPLPWV